VRIDAHYLLAAAFLRSRIQDGPVVVSLERYWHARPRGAGLESMSNPVLVSLQMIQRLFEDGSEFRFFIKALAKD
jgi:hypothetical protein